MPSLKPTLLIALAALSFIACGSTQEAGDDCESESSALCDSDTTALFCDNGALRSIPCRGSAGCTESSTTVSCDMAPRQGDACPKDNEGQAACDSANINQAFRCLSNSWASVACKSCAVSAGKVVCQP